MMILTNGLTDVADEGFLKVANSLVKRIKAANSNIEVVSYERKSPLTDKYIEVNKFLINSKLLSLCKKHKEVLYLPFPARKIALALRLCVLSCFTKRLRVVLVLKTKVNLLSRLLLRLSRAEIIVFSDDAAAVYKKIIGEKRVTVVKTGVDTKKFSPVDSEKQGELKVKYGFKPEQKVVLHVGHLNKGRNLAQLLKIPQEYEVLLVTSSLTKNEQDADLKAELLARGNIRLIDTFVPCIEEIYQLSDVYFFPVTESGRCIDIPLSCLEAAACGKPVVTTAFGEMQQFKNKNGFYFLQNFEPQTIKVLLETAICENKDPRAEVLAYDWDNALEKLV